jgi:FkbM family methyltransferase
MMNLAKLKQTTISSLPGPVVQVLKRCWQGGRRWVNRVYFHLFEPGVTVLDVREAKAGQLNQPIVIDYLLGGLRGGYFLDVGANHPEFNSNTHFFEQHREYTGVALDPLEQYRSSWLVSRPRTRFLNIAAGASAGQIHFYQHANTDGWADQLSFTALSGPSDQSLGSGRLVDMIALADLPGLPSDVTFASIDVEGAESEVLKGFGASLRPRVLVLENCFGPVGNRALRERARNMGYVMVGRISYIDDVFIRADIAATSPSLRELKRQRRELFR